MGVKRFFYVTQDSLTVWGASPSGLCEEFCFDLSTEGQNQFSAYLKRNPEVRSLVVADVIEEEFSTDLVPDLSSGDRKKLIERRLAKRYSRTPFRLGTFHGRRRRESDRFNVTYSAITNRELIDPWLDIVAENKVPLTAVTSVPLLSTELLRKFRKPAENALFLTHHQGSLLRQVFIKSGQPISARLSKPADSTQTDAGSILIDEIDQSRKYLERLRYLERTDSLDVYILTGTDEIASSLSDDERIDCQIHILESSEVVEKLGSAVSMRDGHLESLYLAYCLSKTPKFEYKIRDRRDYSLQQRLRQAVFGLTVAGAIACSALVGVLLTGAFSFKSAANKIETQLTHLEETYRREHAEFESVKADSHEMKLAVDTGEFILRNTLPVAWVMQQIGRVMGRHDDMYIRQLSWQAVPVGDVDADESRAPRRDRALPVPISEIATVTANVAGEIQPYDGNLQLAFDKIDQLAAELQRQTDFERVAVVAYPIDARSAVAVSGEVRRTAQDTVAEFNLSLTLSIEDESR